MLILTSLLMGLVIAVLIVGMGFYLLYANQKRGQAQCDEIAMNMAESLNADNRIGQMNTIVEHSRQLVYLSRHQVITALSYQALNTYAKLANQMSADASIGAADVDAERQNQIGIAMANCCNYASKITKEGEGTWLLSWFVGNRITIDQVEFGSIKNTLSSSESPRIITGLQLCDLESGYMEKTSNLYFGNINATLPSPDQALPFYFSALSPQVQNTNSPTRLVNAEAFVPSTVIFNNNKPLLEPPAQIPGAVRVSGTLHIKTDKQKNQLNIQVNSMASVPGALERL